jgi:DNA mismatch repair protein MutH
MCGEIEILCKALGLPVAWPGGQEEKNRTHADWTEALEMYKPAVTIVESIDSNDGKSIPPHFRKACAEVGVIDFESASILWRAASNRGVTDAQHKAG